MRRSGAIFRHLSQINLTLSGSGTKISMVFYYIERKLTMEFTYKPKGVCSKLMELDIEDGKIQSLKVTGRLRGNLQASPRPCRRHGH